MFFGNMDNQFFDEVQSRDGFGNSFVIFVSDNEKVTFSPS